MAGKTLVPIVPHEGLHITLKSSAIKLLCMIGKYNTYADITSTVKTNHFLFKPRKKGVSILYAYFVKVNLMIRFSVKDLRD